MYPLCYTRFYYGLLSWCSFQEEIAILPRILVRKRPLILPAFFVTARVFKLHIT